jgi:hypothetical protein
MVIAKSKEKIIKMQYLPVTVTGKSINADFGVCRRPILFRILPMISYF